MQGDAMTLEEIEARWKAATPGPWRGSTDPIPRIDDAQNNPVYWCDNYESYPICSDDLRAIAAAPTDIAYLLDRVREHAATIEVICAKLAACDAEATIRGLSATGFPRLWFASLSRTVGLELRSPLASMTGTGNEGSISLAAALDRLSSPALAEMRLQMEKYKRAHAWFVEHTELAGRPSEGGDGRCVCGVMEGYGPEYRVPHEDGCEWVKAKELRI